MCQLALPGMRDQGWGKIVNIGSMGGRFTLPGGGLYHATKYAIEAISDAMRFEVRGFGVDVILIEPGLITTGFADVASGSVSSAGDDGPYAEFNRQVAKRTVDGYEGPLVKLGGGPEVAKTISAQSAFFPPRPRPGAAARAERGPQRPKRRWPRRRPVSQTPERPVHGVAAHVVGPGAGDVARGVADHDRARARELDTVVAGSLPGDVRQRRAVLGVRAEASLPGREVVADPRVAELEARDRLEVAGHQRQAHVAARVQLGQELGDPRQHRV